MKASVINFVQRIKQNSGFVKKWLISPAILIAITIGGYHWLESNKPEPKQREARVKKVKVFVHRAEQKPTQLMGYSQGQVEPKDFLNLKTEIAGNIAYISDNLVAGGIIEKGELLIGLADEDYQLSVISKRARVAQSEQQFSKAKAESELAQKELSDLGRTEASDLAKGLPQLRQAEAALAAAKAELAMAELDLRRTKIYAPFSGRVERRSVSRAQWVNRGMEVARIFASDVMEIRLSLSTDQFSQIGLPLAYYKNYDDSEYPVYLSADLGDEFGEQKAKWQGKIVRTEAVMDDRTRTIFAVAEVHNSYEEGKVPLLKGLFVNAKIAGRTLEAAVTIPKQALRNNEAIWIVDKQQKLQIVEADVVQRTPDAIVVRNLPNRALVITSALAIPTEGLPVKPIFEDPTLQAAQLERAKANREKGQKRKERPNKQNKPNRPNKENRKGKPQQVGV